MQRDQRFELAKVEVENDGKTRWIKEFVLKLEDISGDEIESTAEKYGKALADRISVLAGRHVHAHLKGPNQVMKDGTQGVVSNVLQNMTHLCKHQIGLDLQ